MMTPATRKTGTYPIGLDPVNATAALMRATSTAPHLTCFPEPMICCSVMDCHPGRPPMTPPAMLPSPADLS